MIAERLDIRLIASASVSSLSWQRVRASLSEVVRTMIDRDYEDILRKKRQEAARRLVALEVEDVPTRTR
jgi:hypothetical protein